RSKVQELIGHREFAGFVQTCPGYVEKLRRACEIHRADRDQLGDVPRRKLLSLVIGKRTWRAIVSRVLEFAGDDPGPLGSLAKGEAGALSCPANEVANMRGARGFREWGRRPKMPESGRDHWLDDLSELPNLKVGNSEYRGFFSLFQFNRCIGEVSRTQEDFL